MKDSPDLLFSDLTDWSVVEPNGFPDYRYNDKEIIRAFADNSAPTCRVADGARRRLRRQSAGQRRRPRHGKFRAPGKPRRRHGSGRRCRPACRSRRTRQATTSSGIGFVRPMEAVARESSASQILLRAQDDRHRAREIRFRARSRNHGDESGQDAEHSREKRRDHRHGRTQQQRELPPDFRSAADGRVSGDGRALFDQDASGEIAAMAIGASLWGAYNQTGEFGETRHKAGKDRLPRTATSISRGMPASPVFSTRRAPRACCVRDWQNVILVNQAGLRFYDETKGQYPTANNYGAIKPYIPGSYLNAAKIKWDPANFLNAALAGTGEATMEAARSGRSSTPTPPNARAGTPLRPMWTLPQGYFFSGNTIEELAAQHRQQIPAQADAARRAAGYSDEVQLLRRRGKRRGFRQARAEI